MPKRKTADFRGTITYASLNTHLRKDLSRRDDLWSFYFVILDFLNVNLPWKSVQNKDEVAEIKQKCLRNPSEYLWNTKSARGCECKIKDFKQLKDIFYHIQNLKYESEPNYQLIRMLLLEIRNNYLKARNPPICKNISV
jgi:tau tubulin kinase